MKLTITLIEDTLTQNKVRSVLKEVVAYNPLNII